MTLTYFTCAIHMYTFCRRMTELTEYQGINRMFGHFNCDCGNSWKSGYTWANKSQNCKNCGEAVYPHMQVSFSVHIRTFYLKKI